MDMKRFEDLTIEDLEAVIQAKKEEKAKEEELRAAAKEEELTAAREVMIESVVDYLCKAELLEEEDLKHVDWTALVESVKEAEKDLSRYIQTMMILKNASVSLPSFNGIKVKRVEPTPKESILEKDILKDWFDSL